MAILVIAEFPGMTVEQDKAMTEATNIANDPPPGVRARFAGPTDAGWRIMSVWDSRDAWDAFLHDRLTPALQRAGRSVPDFQVSPLESVFMPQR
jgi:hypothetical protein